MEGVSDPRKGKWTVCLFPLVLEQIQTLKWNYFRLKLRALHRFSSTAAAVEDLTAVQEGKVPKALKHFLTQEVIEKGKGKEVLAVADTKLGEYWLYAGTHRYSYRPQAKPFRKSSESRFIPKLHKKTC
jgi:RNA processing factor Prp31